MIWREKGLQTSQSSFISGQLPVSSRVVSDQLRQSLDHRGDHAPQTSADHTYLSKSPSVLQGLRVKFCSCELGLENKLMFPMRDLWPWSPFHFPLLFSPSTISLRVRALPALQLRSSIPILTPTCLPFTVKLTRPVSRSRSMQR